MGAFAASVLAISAFAYRASSPSAPGTEAAPCLPLWRPKLQVLDRYAEQGIRVVVCAHERARKLVVLQNAGDSELRVKWAATDVAWARPLYPNDEVRPPKLTVASSQSSHIVTTYRVVGSAVRAQRVAARRPGAFLGAVSGRIPRQRRVRLRCRGTEECEAAGRKVH